MAIQVNVDDSKVDNFSLDAQATLKKQMEKYADDIIKEANLIEEAIREDGASTEITSNIILQAVRKSKVNQKKKPNKWLPIIKIVSTLSLLVTGFLYDVEGFKADEKKLIAFIICLVIACVSTVLQFVSEYKE